MTAAAPPRPTKKESERAAMNGREAARRYPNIVAHMMCESLGYFSAGSAANALAAHINGKEWACEGYVHMSADGRSLLQIGADVIRNATSLRARQRHHGHMSNIDAAKMMVKEFVETQGGPQLAAWF